MKKGFLNFILHAHLPYVRHPEYESFFEEKWLFEAITESYIPLVSVLEKLQKDKVNFKLTFSISPTLISMLSDELLQTRYQKYIEEHIELADQEIIRTRNQPQFQKLARLYRRYYLNTQKTYWKYNGALLTAFKKFHQSGHLELLTTAATHGFLPLLNVSNTAVINQVNVGLKVFESNFGFSPSGFWLPECGYFPGLEKTLANAGISYFFMDTHGILDASEKPVNGVYAPLDCGNGVMAFARDPKTSHLVWDAQQGYPGNINYREYYCDIALGSNTVSEPSSTSGVDKLGQSGIKYHRITGDGLKKEVYQPKNAKYEVEQDAKKFVDQCQQQINSLSQSMDRAPIICAPYDAELFGHWWFEGPCWLETVLRLVDVEDNNFEMISCDDYLLRQTSHQIAMPSASSWGEDGYSSYWINEKNSWIYPFLHQATEEMEKLVVDFQGVYVSEVQERALNQAVRSLLLAQASDWPFIMKSGTTTDYANKRITDYLARFNYLHECLRKNRIDKHFLLALEAMDNIFPDIDFRLYQSVNA